MIILVQFTIRQNNKNNFKIKCKINAYCISRNNNYCSVKMIVYELAGLLIQFKCLRNNITHHIILDSILELYT